MPHQFPDQPAAFPAADDPIVLRRSGQATPFPHLESVRFDELKSAAPLLDVNRFLWSPVSEDWITWNAFQLLMRVHGDDWWKAFGLGSAPEVRFWQGPVELVLSSPATLVYVETRMRHDAASASQDEKMRMLVEHADGRAAQYWLFLKAGESPRELSQWMQSAPSGVTVKTLRWEEVLAGVWTRQSGDDSVMAGVKKELRRRTGAELRPQPTAADITRGVLNSRRSKG